MPYPTSIRLPEDVRKILRRTAKQNRRTVTEQINFVLQEWIHAGAGQAFTSRQRGKDVVPRVETITGSSDE